LKYQFVKNEHKQFEYSKSYFVPYPSIIA